ncbi:MAG: hypothetical protein LBQ83_07295 [Candidatus Margulisbacteria bacterium]|jgi:hypothetical protein|nr:hypothetical protein [Candidatus Margulisiibacteriota bacterium]
MVEINAILNRLNSADIYRANGVKEKDGRISIKRDFLTTNAELNQAVKIISIGFGFASVMRNGDEEVVGTILDYVDTLDGEEDGFVELSTVRGFVNTIQNKGAAKDNFLRFLAEKRDGVLQNMERYQLRDTENPQPSIFLQMLYNYDVVIGLLGGSALLNPAEVELMKTFPVSQNVDAFH